MENLRAALVGNLEHALENARLLKHAAYAAQAAESIMLLRTRQGNYLNEGHRRKYSPAWAKRREKEGLATDHVYLYFRGNLLQDIKTKTELKSDSATVEVGYIEGMSDPESIQLATYFNVAGAGRNRVLYKYVGLTDAEIDRLETVIAARIAEELS